MYSLILLMAMGSTSPATPSFGWDCGGCFGCHGGCFGCFGCDGGCWGCHGGPIGWRLRAFFHRDGGCFGCEGGCFGCQGGVVYAAPTRVEPPKPADPSPAQAAQAPAKARIVVSLPADAELTIGGERTPTASNLRVYATPPLEPGSDYTYVLQAEILRQGRKLIETKEIIVRPGEETRVELNPAAIVAEPRSAKILRTSAWRP